ncbi:hypothetical protein ENKOMM257B_06940 [Enterobacter kobei]
MKVPTTAEVQRLLRILKAKKQRQQAAKTAASDTPKSL